jgi:tRNA pseudouridine55 synthase
MTASPFHGLLVLDKPGGLTSRAVVDQVQRWFPRGTRVGHTGTLDPLATGVLVVCVGVATRLTEYVQDMDKVYGASLLLGARSDTDDADGTVTPAAVDQPPDRDAVLRSVQEFIGKIDQLPPAYSAARVSGRRAYDLARRGAEVALRPRRVRIYGIDVLAYDYPRLELEVRCGKGTYIRSLARDLGERLGCGALVRTLRRTRVGPFTAADALSVDTDPATARSRLLPPAAAVAQLPRVTLAGDAAARLRQGQAVPIGDAALGDASQCAVFTQDGVLVAVAHVDAEKGLLRPAKVMS